VQIPDLVSAVSIPRITRTVEAPTLPTVAIPLIPDEVWL
jgi:hypothetical protein